MKDSELVEHIKRLKKAAKAQNQNNVPFFPAEDGDFMLIEKSIPVRMGKWRLVPPEAEHQPYED